MSLFQNILGLRLRLIYKNKSILILAIVILFIFGGLVSGIYVSVEESNRLPIIYVDESHSSFSERLIQNVENNKLFEVCEDSLEEGIIKLKDDEAQLLFLIVEDAAEKVEEGDFTNLIHLYFIQENYLSPMLGDVLVGEMLEEISLSSAMNYLDELIIAEPNRKEILEEAYEYGKNLASNRKENYYVSIEFVNINASQKVDGLDHYLIYKQMILGIILAFIGFYILFSAVSIVKDYEMGLMQKINISKTNALHLLLGNYFSLLIGVGIIALIFSMISGIFSPRFVSYCIMNFLVLLLYISAISAFILFLTTLLNKVSSFVVVGSALILVLGVISGSFFTINLTSETIQNVASITPTYYALDVLVNIVTLGNLKGIIVFIRYVILFDLIFLLLTFLINRKTLKDI